MLTLPGILNPRGKPFPAGQSGMDRVVPGFAFGKYVHRTITIVFCLRQRNRDVLLRRHAESHADDIEIFKKILFIFRQRGREGERRRETSMCGCL